MQAKYFSIATMLSLFMTNSHAKEDGNPVSATSMGATNLTVTQTDPYYLKYQKSLDLGKDLAVKNIYTTLVNEHGTVIAFNPVNFK